MIFKISFSIDVALCFFQLPCWIVLIRTGIYDYADYSRVFFQGSINLKIIKELCGELKLLPNTSYRVFCAAEN